jgi:hypothetical protein
MKSRGFQHEFSKATTIWAFTPPCEPVSQRDLYCQDGFNVHCLKLLQLEAIYRR